MPFSRNELPGSVILELADVPRRVFFLCLIHRAVDGWTSGPDRRGRTLTLWSDGGSFLSASSRAGDLTDHHEQTQRFEKEARDPKPFRPAANLRASFSHDAAICVVRIRTARRYSTLRFLL